MRRAGPAGGCRRAASSAHPCFLKQQPYMSFYNVTMVMCLPNHSRAALLTAVAPPWPPALPPWPAPPPWPAQPPHRFGLGLAAPLALPALPATAARLLPWLPPAPLPPLSTGPLPLPAGQRPAAAPASVLAALGWGWRLQRRAGRAVGSASAVGQRARKDWQWGGLADAASRRTGRRSAPIHAQNSPFGFWSWAHRPLLD